jgi:hypothetical membrane protein
MLTRKEKWALEIATVFVVTAAVLYCSWPLGFILNPTAEKTGLASELGALHQPYNWLFIWADIVSGVLLAAACWLLAKQMHAQGWRKAGLILLAIYGICGALDAALPIRCLPSEQICGPILHDPLLIFHGLIDFIGSLALVGTFVAEWRYAKRYHPAWLPWIYIIGSGGMLFAALSLYFILTHGPGYWAQRYYITLSCVWVASLPFVFRAQSRAKG